MAAAAHYKTAAEKGDNALAQKILAVCYLEGKGVEVNMRLAEKWAKACAAREKEPGAESEFERGFSQHSGLSAKGLLQRIRRCSFCGAPNAKLVCAACKEARYCDQACQRRHWKRATEPHKAVCSRAAESGEASGGGGGNGGGGGSSSSA